VLLEGLCESIGLANAENIIVSVTVNSKVCGNGDNTVLPVQ
jgi:hypothetical protein